MGREVDAWVQADTGGIAMSEVTQGRLVGLGVEIDALPLVRHVLAPGQEVDLATLIKIHFTGKRRFFPHESASVMNPAVGELCFGDDNDCRLIKPCDKAVPLVPAAGISNSFLSFPLLQSINSAYGLMCKTEGKPIVILEYVNQISVIVTGKRRMARSYR